MFDIFAPAAPAVAPQGGVSSFGYGGTIAHAVLHAAPAAVLSAGASSSPPSTVSSVAPSPLLKPFLKGADTRGAFLRCQPIISCRC